MYIYLSPYIYTCKHIHIHVYTHMYMLWVCIYIYVYVYAHIHVRVHVTCTYAYAYAYAITYIATSIYIYTHMGIHVYICGERVTPVYKFLSSFTWFLSGSIVAPILDLFGEGCSYQPYDVRCVSKTSTCHSRATSWLCKKELWEVSAWRSRASYKQTYKCLSCTYYHLCPTSDFIYISPWTSK